MSRYAVQSSVSVVMAVRNERDSITRTLDSLKEQSADPVEVIVVDDGSDDGTPDELEKYARHWSRLKVVSRENEGITRSLQIACDQASGDLIARQDGGDVSTPGRMEKQSRILSDARDVAMVSSWVRYVGPDGEPAGGIRHDLAEADAALSVKDDRQKRVRGPYHGAAMFRRSDYEAVGGYREVFYFAQDVDLWLRLHELGEHRIIPEELYVARIDPDSITGRFRVEQDGCLELAVEAARARRAGRSEAPYLAEAASIRPDYAEEARGRGRRARSFYFMGCLLAPESPASATRYFLKSIRAYPFSPKAWVRFGGSWLKARRGRGPTV